MTGRVSDPKGRPMVGVRVAGRPGGRPRPVRSSPRSPIARARSSWRDCGAERVPIILSRPPYQLQTETIPADKDEVALTYRLQPDEAARRQVAPVEDEPIPQDLRGA